MIVCKQVQCSHYATEAPCNDIKYTFSEPQVSRRHHLSAPGFLSVSGELLQPRISGTNISSCGSYLMRYIANLFNPPGVLDFLVRVHVSIVMVSPQLLLLCLLDDVLRCHSDHLRDSFSRHLLMLQQNNFNSKLSIKNVVSLLVCFHNEELWNRVPERYS